MENYGEFLDGKNYVIVEFHSHLTLSFLKARMDMILANSGTYDPDDIVLFVDLSGSPDTASFGVIRTKRGRIFELHVLAHPVAIEKALIGANGRKIVPTHTSNPHIQ